MLSINTVIRNIEGNFSAGGTGAAERRRDPSSRGSAMEDVTL